MIHYLPGDDVSEAGCPAADGFLTPVTDVRSSSESPVDMEKFYHVLCEKIIKLVAIQLICDNIFIYFIHTNLTFCMSRD